MGATNAKPNAPVEASDELPLTGFSMKALQQFCSRYDRELPQHATTSDVCGIVKNVTKDSQVSLVDWWKSKEDGVANKLVGKATIFVSHAWQYNFKALVQVLSDFWQNEGSPEDMFFWYDCFVVNQHYHNTISYEKLEILFGKSVQLIGRALIVLMPWHQPIYISRCWCLFEMFVILKNNIKHDIRMSVDDEKHFIKNLINGSLLRSADGGLFKKLENIKSRNGEAREKDDENNIKKAIAQSIGFNQLDKTVFETLREWFANVGMYNLEKMLQTDNDYLALLNNLAILLGEGGKYVEAEKLFRRCLQLKEQKLGDEHPSTLSTINNLANCLDKQCKYAEAEQMYRKCLQLKEKIQGSDHPETLASLNNLANYLNHQGKLAEAEQMYKKCVELKEKKLGDDHPSTLASINNLGSCLDNQGKYAEAEQMKRKCLALMEKKVGPEHPDTLSSINNLAICLDKQGKRDEAEQMYRKCLELRVKLLGEDHPDTQSSINNLANCLSNQGKHDEAEQLKRKCLALSEKVLGNDHPDTLSSASNLASCLADQGKYVEAEQIYRKCSVQMLRSLGSKHPSTNICLAGYRKCLANQGKDPTAEITAILNEARL